jgi:hypothetical protein
MTSKEGEGSAGTWTRLPAIPPGRAGLRSGCPTCGRRPIELPMDAPIIVGFGFAGVTRDGVVVWSEQPDSDVGIDDDGDDDDATILLVNVWTVQDAENAAFSDPDHDWRVVYYGPLSEAVYQRHGIGQWLLVKRGMGFA